MSNEGLGVKREEVEFDDIYQDPADESFNFTMVPNDLIRDKSISPQCRWLIIFLISNKPEWKIKTRQLWEHTKGFIGRDGIRKALNEAINAGYIRRDIILRKTPKGSLRGYSYVVSRSPKFKKCLRQPENQDTDLQEPDYQGPENQGTKEILSSRILSKNTNTTTTPPNPKPENPKSEQPKPTPVKPETPKDRGGVASRISFNRKTKSFDGMTPEILALLHEAFPGVNIQQQLKEMALWLMANPHRQGTQPFITKWLKKSMQELPKPYVREEDPVWEVDPEMQKMMDERDARIQRELQAEQENQDEG